jgi:carboxymethylenebutenolidase
MKISTEWVNLQVSDGTTMRGYVAWPTGVRASACMIVFQEAFGVNAHIRDVTERFAGAGYIAIAPELYHRTAGPGFETGYTGFPQSVTPHFQSLKDDQLAADIQAAYDHVKKTGDGLPIAAVGYCVGGRITTLASMTVPLMCAIAYYGGGVASGGMFPALTPRFSEIKSPMLFFWGGQDAHIGPAAVREVEDAAKSNSKSATTVIFSYADHGFFCDARASYNKQAARQAWALTLEFLEANIAAQKTAGA